MKKLEIEKTKPTFIISTFKTDIIKVGLVFSISNFFIAKTSLANNWRSFSSSYSALRSKLLKSFKMKPFFHWSQWMYWFMHQTSLIKVIKHRKITNWWHFCQHQNQNNTFLQHHSLYAQLKTAETITNKTD